MPSLRRILVCLAGFLCLPATNALGAVKTASPAKGSVIVFLDAGCPIARHHTLTLRQLHQRFAERGIRFQALFPNAAATPKSVAAFAKKFQLPFPAAVDSQQATARKLKANTVPEAFVFDADDQLVYRGRIDDAFAAVGKRRAKVTRHDLANALQALASGASIQLKTTVPIGCPITFLPPQS